MPIVKKTATAKAPTEVKEPAKLKKSKLSNVVISADTKIPKVKLPSAGKPLIGCHVSIAGGLQNAPARAALFGCETLQIFSRSPQGGAAAPITPELAAEFKVQMQLAGLTSLVIHAPYILNLGSAKKSTYHGSINLIRTDLERGSLLGAQYVMFHPGSFKDLGPKEGMKQARSAMKEILKNYKGTTQLLIEISAGAGEVIGDTFEEIAELMDPVKKHKGFGGVCFDTQHAFGSGYDLRTPEAVKKTFTAFDKAIGLEFLRMCHFNDSKVEFGSHRDRHEHIGEGHMGKNAFSAMFSYFKQKKLAIPLILETEHDKVESDIKTLKSLRDKAWK
ncbi:MAG TPA: deoxyribonuclease IV [Patescibacteria group bacterium]|nr:deoxyribonuclease IV [Patescibacteria group bacterium]